MSERLEELKRKAKSMAKMVDPPIFYREISEDDYQYLIKQAKLNDSRKKEIDNLHGYLTELREQIESHAPEGKNYTNAQYVELLHERNKYREALVMISDETKCEQTETYANSALEE